MSKILLGNLMRIVWRNIGYNLYYTAYGMKLAPFIGVFLVTFIPILALLKLFLEDASIPNIANAFESTGPYSQLFVKCVFTRLSATTIQELISDIETKFWPIDYFGPEIKEKQMKAYRMIEFCTKLYIISIYPCITLMICAPLLYEERMFPLAVYNLGDINNNNYYLPYYGIQIIGFIYATGSFLAIDGLFALYVVNVLCQLIMLQHGFSSLNITEITTKDLYEEKYRKIKEYVDHHNLLLRFIQKMQDIYSIQLFFQFVGNTASICMGVYIISATGMSNITTSLRAALIVIVWFCQLSIYCVGGTLLTESCSKVAFSMYSSYWEGQYTAKFRYATQIVIMQAQNPKIMRAGKIFDINLSSFSGIIRLAVSIYTLMNKVQNKN